MGSGDTASVSMLGPVQPHSEFRLEPFEEGVRELEDAAELFLANDPQPESGTGTTTTVGAFESMNITE